MKPYRRVMAAIDVDEHGEAIAREGWEIARLHGAAFALAHVVNYGHGLDIDHFPFLTPGEVEAMLGGIVSRHLGAIARRLGADSPAVLIAFGKADRELPGLVLSWQPDLVVVGARAAHGLKGNEILEVEGDHSHVRTEALVIPVRRPARRRGIPWMWMARLVGNQ